jgi:hypothetical protein
MTDFDLTAFDAADEATLAIKHPTTGEPTTWLWTFYGPGHPATIELANRVSREALREISAQKQARINGKKWKEDEQSIDTMRAENVKNIVARTKTFTPVKMGGVATTFTPEAASELLLDRRKSWLLTQIMDFLREEESFIQPSETN